MKNSWKTFIIVIAALICTVIVCLTINISVGKITKSISADANTPGDSNTQSNQDNDAGFIDDNTDISDTSNPETPVVTDEAGNVVSTPAGVNTTASAVSGGGSTVASGSNATSAVSANPLNYSKSQLVSFYNTCLKKSYSQPKMNDTKSEKIAVSFDENGVLVNGNTNSTVTGIANMIISANQKDTSTSMSFTNGVSSDGTTAANFVLPTNLSPAGVKSATISKSGSGYKMVITLVKESCNFTTMPPYNKSCAWPLNFKDIDFKGYAEITSATFVYPGTKLTATIDSNGRVSYVQVNMPLSVSNATGTVLKVLKGTTIGVSKIQGEWVCKNTMTF